MSTELASFGGLPFCGIQCPGVAPAEPSSPSTQFIKHNHHHHSHQQKKTNGDRKDRNDVEAILVQGMQHLTFDELQQEQEDLHGVSAECQEDNQAIDGLLESLKEHLNRIKTGTVYESAEKRNPSYVTNRGFQTMFLRGNRYDPKAAAVQIIRFYATKQDLFGTDKLVRDITLQDMDQDDMEALMCGSIQMSSCLDRSGRVVLLAIPGLRSFKSIKNELRYEYYVCMELLKQSQESQNKGVVVVSYFVDKCKDSKNGEGFSQTMGLLLSLPFNLAGFHWCLDDPAQLLFGKMAFSLMPPRLRAKTKMHFGSHFECQYLLASYGIPREAIPFSSSYDIDLSYHKYWLKKCAQKEEESNGHSPSSPQISEGGVSSSNYGCCPTENDVLCIGRKASGAGNDRLMTMANSFADSYDLGTIKSRRAIINCMMDEIRKHGGRFLKPDTSEEGEGGWIEVEEKEMRKKIGQTFRNLRRRRVASKCTGSAGVGTRPASPPSVVTAEEVKPNDVLFGKNKLQRGNQLLQDLIEQMAADYDSSNRGQKKLLASSLVCKIKESGGRFLKPMEDGRWEVVSDDEVAEQKVSVHFRNFRRKKR
mmetsp:Transcript_43675/g.105348  ORF Transcript_43675/g.105348 Transcript_43675/m.105348 type:complete len:590 (+) Transcript_43675:107-1876(+)